MASTDVPAWVRIWALVSAAVSAAKSASLIELSDDVTFSIATFSELMFVCSVFFSNAPSRPRVMDTSSSELSNTDVASTKLARFLLVTRSFAPPVFRLER